MKKICFINNLYKPYDQGGAEKIVEERAKEYRDKGYESIIISWKPWSGLNSWKPELEEKEGIKIYRFWVPNIFSYKSLSEHWILSKLVWHFINLFNVFSANIVENVLKENPDVVETHNLMGIGFLTPRAVKGLNITHVHYLHDVQLVEPSGILHWNHKKDSLAQTIYSSVLKILFGQPDKVISPSKFLEDFYKSRGFFLNSEWETKEFDLQVQKRIEPQAIDYSRIIKFLFVGSLEKHKGVEFLKQVWDEYISVGKELHIIGDGSLKPELRGWANNRQGVKMYGRLVEDRLVEKYKECDVLVFPSVCLENSPNVVKEALEHSLFVVASKTGGVKEFEDYNVWFFEPENIQEAQRRIAEVSVNVLVKRGLSTEKRSQDEFEVNWSKYFIKYVNKVLGTNYEIVNNEEENSDIDVFGMPKNKEQERLNIQLTQIHPEFFYQSAGMNELVDTKQREGGQTRIQFLLEDAIDRKSKKYSNPSDIILLLQGYFEIYKIKEAVKNISPEKIKTWNFKGIYYASPGINRGGVVPVKDCFN